MKGKKSFVLYADLLESVDHLTDEEMGRLFRHLLEYVNDQNPELSDRLLLTAWKPIERSLKQDLEKWRGICEKRAQAGAKGGKQKVANLANATNAKQNLANVADSDTVSDTDNDSVINNPLNPPKGEEVVLPFDSENFKAQWQLWKAYKKKQHRFTYKHEASEQAALTSLSNMATGQERKAIAILHYTMANGWKGFVAPKDEGTSTKMTVEDILNGVN